MIRPTQMGTVPTLQWCGASNTFGPAVLGQTVQTPSSSRTQGQGETTRLAWRHRSIGTDAFKTAQLAQSRSCRAPRSLDKTSGQESTSRACPLRTLHADTPKLRHTHTSKKDSGTVAPEPSEARGDQYAIWTGVRCSSPILKTVCRRLKNLVAFCSFIRPAVFVFIPLYGRFATPPGHGDRPHQTQ